MKEFYIFGKISAQTARDIADFFNQNKNETTLHINSVGGEILSAITIYNLIKQRGKVSIFVDGLCASAATLICCSCKVTAAKNSLFMIHLPLAELYSLYNAEELQKISATLDKIKSLIVETYQSKLKISAEEIEKLMAAETYMTAEDALKIGLIDEISELETPLQNLFGVKNMNEELMAKFKQSVLADERARVAMLNAMRTDSPAVNSIINKAIENGKAVEEVKPFIDEVVKKSPEPKIKNLDELYKMITDNLSGGGQNVDASTPNEDDEKAAYINNVSKFANEILKGQV